MANRVLAIFTTAADAMGATEELRRQGFASGSVALLSSEPIHGEIEKGLDGKRSRIGIFAIAGGVIGAMAAVGLTAVTSRSMNLVTGGMPIVAPWAFGIIVFEMTALGAIVSTLGRMVFEARLFRRALPEECDSAIADGKAVVVVDAGDEDRVGAAQEVLTRRGAEVL
ncbi:MAG TPA: quinol:electron acceptor oxidoreductase subunit ActD [Blastocatellia bacterium]|jgi:hypothetical protein|nr:quinol:electron acceptor oxidoreductase subunit ActD [Blastocatellia bacterium]